MAHKKVSITRKWYGKVPSDKNGNPIPKNLWAKRRKYSWEVRWYNYEGTKRYSKSLESRKEAEVYANKVQGQVNTGKADKPRQITLGEFIDEHEKVMTNRVAFATLSDQLRAMNIFADYIGRDVILEHIRPNYAESFLAKRSGEDVSVATVNKDIRTLKALFNVAIEPRRYIAEGANPFANIKERKIASSTNRYVEIEDFKKVYAACKNIWWRTLLTLAYTSAGRRDELLNLTWLDIDFDSKNICIAPKRVLENVLAWEPKDHESRIVPIPSEAVQHLADMQAEADEESPYVFVSRKRLACILLRRSKQLWKPNNELINNLMRDLKRIICQAKVDTFTLHDLRRSCITNWAKSLPIQSVQQLAGHSNIETTRKYYLSVQQADLNLAREVQSNYIGSLTNF
jgi:integrase